MRKSLALFALCLFTSVSYANTSCDKQPTKAQVEACYKQRIDEKVEALQEYHEAIMTSQRIPSDVKAQIDKDFRSFMRNIHKTCPDSACVDSAMMNQIRDMYQETRKFTTPQ